jgi:osmoprotectant transport system ATP-binding protein
MINALQAPDGGNIQVDGKDLSGHDLQALRRRMGYCVQSIALFPHLSIQQNICLLAQMERWPEEKIARRLQILLHLTALASDVLSRYPHQLSGGQQQRAGLCRALMLNPDFLLLDEPFAAVDPITRVDIHDQYQQLQGQEPRTTLLVTHDIQEALKLADTIVVMRAGVITAHHSSSELKAMPTPETVLLNQIRHGYA